MVRSISFGATSNVSAPQFGGKKTEVPEYVKKMPPGMLEEIEKQQRKENERPVQVPLYEYEYEPSPEEIERLKKKPSWRDNPDDSERDRGVTIIDLLA